MGECVCVAGGWGGGSGGGNLGTTYLIPNALYSYSPVKHMMKKHPKNTHKNRRNIENQQIETAFT